MSQAVLAEPPAVADRPVPVLDHPPRDFRELGIEYELWEPDPRQFRSYCERVARVLANNTFEERLIKYRRGDYSRRVLSAASALCPELMPTLNGEFEWIALRLADLD